MASALGVVVAVLLARVSRQLIYSAMAMMMIGIVGLIILLAIPDGEIKLLGYYLSWASTGSYALLLTFIGKYIILANRIMSQTLIQCLDRQQHQRIYKEDLL